MTIPDAFVPTILLAHAASTWFMIGLIWFVQVVHYPLLSRVESSGYKTYQHAHQRRTTLVVAPVMLAELICAIIIAISRIEHISPMLSWSGLALVVLIWMSTAFLQVPCHNQLGAGFDERVHRRLVRTNWLRTIAWSVRGCIVIAML